MKYILAIDEGTSSTRARLYTTEGVIVATSQYELTQLYPKTGWVEHDPEQIWRLTLKAIQEVASKVEVHDIKALGITNQRETIVLWDKQTGTCLGNAIVWQDRRTQKECDALKADSKRIQNKTGLRPDPYFSASKLRWMLTHQPEAMKLAKQGKLAAGTIDSFLIWRLTKGNSHVTDYTNAQRTLLFNLFDQAWDDELLALFDVPKPILPQVLDCDAEFGWVAKEFLGTEIPITGVAGDQHAALIGQCCVEKGMVKATFGTGGFLLLNTGEAPVLSENQLLSTIAYRVQGVTHFGIEGSLYQAGTTVKWLRDELKIIKTADETEILARSLKDNGGLYLIPSFTGMGAPYWLDTNGAVLTGLKRNTTPAHIARAALECVSYQTRDVLTCMEEDFSNPLSVLRVDGGMTQNNWFLSHLANQTNLTVQKPSDNETTARGAALLAGIGAGEFNSLPQLAEQWALESSFAPQEDASKRTEAYEGWANAMKMMKQST